MLSTVRSTVIAGVRATVVTAMACALCTGLLPVAPRADALGAVRADSAYPVVVFQNAPTGAVPIGRRLALSVELHSSGPLPIFWAGHDIVYTISDTSVASLQNVNGSAHGGADSAIVTGKKAGSVVLTATTESKTSATVTLSFVQAFVSHEPPGMTTAFDTGPLTSGAPTSPTGKSSLAWASGGTTPVTVTILGSQGPSGTIQLSSSASIEAQASGYRITFPQGQVNDPAMALALPFKTLGTGTFYLRYRLRLGSTWSVSAMNAGRMKLFAPKSPGGGGIDDIVMGYMTATGAGYVPGVGLQGPTTANIPSGGVAPPGLVFQSGVWNTVEVLFTPDSPVGAGNASVTLWLNDGVAYTRTGVSIFGKGTTPNWGDLQVYASRSVYSGVQAKTTFVDIDQLYGSVK